MGTEMYAYCNFEVDLQLTSLFKKQQPNSLFKTDVRSIRFCSVLCVFLLSSILARKSSSIGYLRGAAQYILWVEYPVPSTKIFWYVFVPQNAYVCGT